MGDLPTGQITLGRYLWTRIHQIGCTTIFGVPGDFNLQFLDSIFLTPGLKWCGNQNELNAAYAADGYARVKGIPGCVVTTHGVGELSALNGIAGAMSEHVKVIHVVGQTTRVMQEKKMMIHHSIGHEPDHQVYNKASKGLRYDAAELWDIESAPGEIDRVIRECFLKSGPVYIFLPLDLSSEMVDASLLETPINVLPDVNEKAQEEAVKAIVAAVKEAKRPTVLVDAWTQRFGASEEAGELVRRLGVPFFSANMGKGVVDETDEMYVGVWNGAVSAPGVEAIAKAADLVVRNSTFGPDVSLYWKLGAKKHADNETDHTGLYPCRHQRSRILTQDLRLNSHTYQPSLRGRQIQEFPQHMHQIFDRGTHICPPIHTATLHPETKSPTSTDSSGQRRDQTHSIFPLALDRKIPPTKRRHHQ